MLRFPLLLSLATLLGSAPALRAQEGGRFTRSSGVIAGMVVDAGTGAALSGALIVVESVTDGVVLRPATSGMFVSRGMTAVTDADGKYRVTGLAPGPYRLYVRHLAYRESALDLELSQSSFHLSVGLVVNPIRLLPIGVESASGQVYGRTRTTLEESRAGRTVAEEMRQERFFESDARVLTQSEVTEAVTLGESDLLRAIQRLPGVSSRDDYTAGIWTRGAPWSQTRAYYDGLPLFNPVHAFGLISSLSPDAVGLATFHPGVRSASIGDGAAGVLALTSRGAERAGFHGLSELSVASARAAIETASRNGERGLVLGARRSYVDIATELARVAGGNDAVYVPYSFLDLTARADLRNERNALQLSGLFTEDNIQGKLWGLLVPTAGRWGNRIGHASYEHLAALVRVRTSLGTSSFQGLVNPPPRRRFRLSNRNAQYDATQESGGPASISSGVPVRHGATRNELDVLSWGTEISEASGTRRPSWAGGFQLTSYVQWFDGQVPRPYLVTVGPDNLRIDQWRVVPSLWGERRWFLSPSFAVETGLRLERPKPTRNIGLLAAAPRVTARYTSPNARLTVSGGIARSWQYTQSVAPAGPSVGPDLYLTDVWLLAADTIPALRSDIATLGGELALGQSWIAGVTGYVRYATGMAVPDPAPGLLDQRPLFVTGTNRAEGVELGLRRIVGRFTASLGYTLARSTVRASGYTYPSTADRRHTVDGTAMFRLTPGSRIGAALTAGSGSPYSRAMLAVRLDSLGNQTTDTLATSIGWPNAQRTPVYAALDLLFDTEGRLGRGGRIGAFIQLRNVFNRTNAVTYTGTVPGCTAAPPQRVEREPGTCDRFDRGIPFLPLAGVRISF